MRDNTSTMLIQTFCIYYKMAPFFIAFRGVAQAQVSEHCKHRKNIALELNNYSIPQLKNIIGCAKEWDKHRGKDERAIHPDEIRAYLKTADNVFRYKFHNRWIVNYDQLEPYLKELSKTETPYWVEIVKMKSAGRRGKKA